MVIQTFPSYCCVKISYSQNIEKVLKSQVLKCRDFYHFFLISIALCSCYSNLEFLAEPFLPPEMTAEPFLPPEMTISYPQCTFLLPLWLLSFTTSIRDPRCDATKLNFHFVVGTCHQESMTFNIKSYRKKQQNSWTLKRHVDYM